MAFKYTFSKVYDPLNSTTCGYIKAEETQWENSSCSVTFDNDNNYIYCNCRHMSYYSVIDDYLKREAFPIDNIDFQNWLSIIPFGYMLIILIFGMIYTNSKDNQDFRILNKQDNKLGMDLMVGNSVTIKTLLFKRKVFFTGFGERYTFNRLLRIMIIKMHPLFQLKYKFDPEIPRFYKFIALYTRIMMMFALSFFVIREYRDVDDVKNSDDIIIALVKIFVILVGGSLLFAPIPSFLYQCCRSRYFLIRQKGGMMFDDEKLTPKNVDSQGPLDNNQEQYKSDVMVKDKDQKQPQDSIEHERFTNVKIDTNLPLKLLFLLDRASTDKIIRDYPTVMNYSSGDTKPLAEKLYELDIDINPEQLDQQHFSMNDNPNIFINQMNSEHGGAGSDDTNRKLNDINPKKMKTIEDVEISESQNYHVQIPFNINNQNFENDNNKFSASISQVHNAPSSVKPLSSLHFQILDSGSRPVTPSDIDYDLGDEEEIKEDRNEKGIPSTPHLGHGQPQVQNPKAILISDQQNPNNNNDDDQNFSRVSVSSPYTSRSQMGQYNQTAKKLNPNENQFTDPDNNDNLGESQKFGHSNTNLIMESFLGSLESQLDVDEKKELVEQSKYCGRLFGNILALIINIGILVAIFYFYITEKYYKEDNNWIWIVVFFGAQFIGFLIIDFIVLAIMAACVSTCFKRQKSCLARWMKETLIIYEDFKYIMEFAETNKID